MGLNVHHEEEKKFLLTCSIMQKDWEFKASEMEIREKNSAFWRGNEVVWGWFFDFCDLLWFVLYWCGWMAYLE